MSDNKQVGRATDVCPYCFKQTVEGGFLEVFQNDEGTGGVSQDCWCLICEKHWTDYYAHVLTRIENLVPANQEVAM